MLEARQLGRMLPPPQSRTLLRNISFTLERGEVLAIVGPSGAGKSTLLRLLNRLDEPTSGEVLLQGVDTKTLPPRELRRRMGMVMQRAYLFPGTVAENLAYGPTQRHQAMSPEEINSLLEQVGLAGYAQRDALTLSGGEAQRVAITRALANQPEVLLLDEPTSALDESARRSIEALLESLVRQRHLTCVWITHNLEQARTVADKVLAIEAGQMTAYGPVHEVLQP
jgi:putative ABC transport system ATP-binding protein